MRERIRIERTNLRVQALAWHRVLGGRNLWLVASDGATVCLPLRTASIEQLDLGMTKQPERPKCVSRPPVRFVAVKHDRGVGSDSILPTHLGETLGRDIIALSVVLQIPSPIDMHGSRNVTGVVEENV